MKVFFSIFFCFSAVFLTIFGINCFYGYIFPMKYQAEIASACYEFSVDREIVFSMINVESHFNNDAISPKGAVGLMQIMPSTAQFLADELGLENFDLKNENDNIRLGTYYISKLLKQFKNVDTALSAYNAGPTTVSNWLKDENLSDDGESLKNIPYQETRNYIEKFDRNLKYYRSKLK